MTVREKIFLVVIIAAAFVSLYEASQISSLNARNRELSAQLTPLQDELQQLHKRLDDLTAQLAIAQSRDQHLIHDNTDLARLRHEVDYLKDALKTKQATPDNSIQNSATTWLDRVNALKQAFDQSPTNRIPEFQLLTDDDWLDAAKLTLDSDADYRKAMAYLRNLAQSRFGSVLQPALSQYLQANNDQAPSDLSQLQQYMTNQLDPSIFHRYAVLPSSSVGNVMLGGNWIITEVSPVDSEYDSRTIYGPSGNSGSTSFKNNPLDTLTPALQAYAAANGGKPPSDLSALSPYATTPDQQSALQKILTKSP